jgi:hypothetical protein
MEGVGRLLPVVGLLLLMLLLMLPPPPLPVWGAIQGAIWKGDPAAEDEEGDGLWFGWLRPPEGSRTARSRR